jgi:predicted DNA-binding transcriptional regulator AlpA
MTTPTTPNATSDDLSNDVAHLSEHVGRLLTSTEVADVIRVPHATLRYWRHIGVGPKSFKMGPRRVLYREEDVLAWVADQYGATG